MARVPRVIVAGLAGDTGKSLVALGLVRAFRRAGRRVAPFKKGPDFIDASLLTAAAGDETPARNLDSFLMPEEALLGSVSRAADDGVEIAVIEGNRGLFDGMDSEGSHSTAALANRLGAPLLLVVDTTKVTRTVAALVLGCQQLDPALRIGGVILNRVATARQERVIRSAVGDATGLPVLGAIPRLRHQHLPSRHLGLIPAAERPSVDEVLDDVADVVHEHVDLAAIAQLADGAPALPDAPPRRAPPAPTVRVGVLRDEAFSFYYPDNLEALRHAGAELRQISALRGDASALDGIDGLYIGGGFPEVYAADLAGNEPFRAALRRRIEQGLPVWAECGGLVYLARELQHDGQRFPMVGALSAAVDHTARPQGHGYVRAQVDSDNPFLARGTPLNGHEFHYSRLEADGDLPTVLSLERGVGVGRGRDGLAVDRVVASYTHIHAAGTPSWAPGLVTAARGA